MGAESTQDNSLGLQSLRTYHFKNEEVWHLFLDMLRDDRYSLFHYRIIDFFAIGTSNPDVFRSGADYEVCERNAHLTINRMSKTDVIKLLAFVDSENGFERGSMGEWIDFIIQAIPDNTEILQEIIGDRCLSTGIRENALFLFACYEPAAFLKLESGKVLDCYEMLSDAIEKYGGIFPYM